MKFAVLIEKLLRRMVDDEWDSESMSWTVTQILEIYREVEENPE